MSVVTNVVFSFHISEKYKTTDKDEFIYHNMQAINQWLNDNDFGEFGKDADIVSGGDKHLETPLFIAAFNHFNLDGFINLIRSLTWEHRDCVQLFIQKQDDDKFTLVEPFIYTE